MISSIDLDFLEIPGAIAAFLVTTDDGPILIETGPHSTLPVLKRGVALHGYQIEDIQHVFLTHIHLDHAGSAWALAKHGANIYVHPFGAKHLLAPEKLMDSARRIYQDDMDRLWGQMHGIKEQQLVTVEHLESVDVGGKKLIAHHTPGHARHHIAWQLDGNLFSGDVAGVKIGDGPVVAPCPPPDIDLEAWRQSIQLIRDLQPQSLWLTHFGEIRSIAKHLHELDACLNDWSKWIRKEMDDGKSIEDMTPRFKTYTNDQLVHHKVDALGKRQYEAANPAWMSVAGLVRYWNKKQS